MSDELSREELLAAAKIMADMITSEWMGTLTNCIGLFGPDSTPEEMGAIRKLEAYLSSRDGT